MIRAGFGGVCGGSMPQVLANKHIPLKSGLQKLELATKRLRSHTWRRVLCCFARVLRFGGIFHAGVEAGHSVTLASSGVLVVYMLARRLL